MGRVKVLPKKSRQGYHTVKVCCVCRYAEPPKSYGVRLKCSKGGFAVDDNGTCVLWG